LENIQPVAFVVLLYRERGNKGVTFLRLSAWHENQLESGDDGKLASIRYWITSNLLKPDQPLLINRFGGMLSGSGVAFRLEQAVVNAVRVCLSLRGERSLPIRSATQLPCTCFRRE
jgi:hypothetical protein